MHGIILFHLMPMETRSLHGLWRFLAVQIQMQTRRGSSNTRSWTPSLIGGGGSPPLQTVMFIHTQDISGFANFLIIKAIIRAQCTTDFLLIRTNILLAYRHGIGLMIKQALRRLGLCTQGFPDVNFVKAVGDFTTFIWVPKFWLRYFRTWAIKQNGYSSVNRHKLFLWSMAGSD